VTRVASTWGDRRLPRHLTGFVGRAIDLEKLGGMLGSHRVVTITGVGGCGKTRLAVELAARVGGRFGDGVWWVDLAGVADSRLVAGVVAAALPLFRGSAADPVPQLVGELQSRHVLVVLDSCEHVWDGCAQLGDAILRACPGVTMLCTSRQPLGVEGEVVWRLAPLSVPGEQLDPEEAKRFEAVQLFVERGQRRRPGFAWDSVSAPLVGSICRRLDGLPLALELAAAWMSSMTLEQIERATAEHVLALGGTLTGRPPRHQTLEASIDWSYRQLASDEQCMFRRLSVFAGDFTVEAADRVCAAAEGATLPVLIRLVDRSLIDLVEAGGGRYRLLQTVRHFAARELERAGEADGVRNRHFDYCRSLGRDAGGRLQGPHASRWLERLEVHRDDILAAIGWARRTSRADDARSLAADVLVFWMLHYPNEGLAQLEAVLEGEGGALLPRARAYSAAAWLALYGAFDLGRSLRYAREAVSLGRQLGRADVTAAALNHLAWAAVYAAPDDARAALEEAVTLHERDQNLPQLAHALAGLGFVAMQEGRGTATEDLLGRSLETARLAGDGIGTRRALAFLGAVTALHGDLDRAESLLEECLERARRLGDRYFIAHALDYLAVAALHRGSLDTASRLLGEALTTARLSSPMAQARTLVQIGHHAFVAGDLAEARSSLLAVPAGAWGVTWYLARRLPLLAEVALLDDDLDAAQELVDQALILASRPERPWALALGGLAHARLLRARGSVPQATAVAHDVLTTFVRTGHGPDTLDALELLSQLRNDAGRPDESARLFGAAAGARERFGLRRPPVHDPGVHATTQALAGTLGAEWTALFEAGATLTIEEALAYASRGRGERRRPPAGWESLTPAERRLALLIAEGLSNADIAARLFISAGTVRAHLGHIYGKLGIGTRAQLAAEVARRGMAEHIRNTRQG
jgi:predicted ATPase/DNA-binding CsgD family transcriptional regulator